MSEKILNEVENTENGIALAGQVEPLVMCIAIATDINKPCGCQAGHPLRLSDGTQMPLCWHHAQMIKSGWYMAVGDEIAGQEKLRYYRTNKYGT